MSNIGKGLLAGLAATVVLSVLMVLKGMIELMPAVDPPTMLAGMMGFPSMPIVGWVIHFFVGIVIYGIAIATLGPRLDLGLPLSAMLIGAVGWLIVMLVLMPLAGAGLFGMSMGAMAAVLTLLLHLIFGAALGGVYDWLATGRMETRNRPRLKRGASQHPDGPRRTSSLRGRAADICNRASTVPSSVTGTDST